MNKNFKSGTIRVSLHADIHKCGWLAVHRHLLVKDAWVITHVPTGVSISKTSNANAYELADYLAKYARYFESLNDENVDEWAVSIGGRKVRAMIEAFLSNDCLKK